jgi:hypothetical protein
MNHLHVPNVGSSYRSSGRLFRAATALLSVATVAVGCSDNTSDPAQPAPNVTTFEQGVFDNIPAYPRSDPLGERNDEDGVVSRSYRSVGALPQTIIDYYDAQLTAAGWQRSAALPQQGFVRRGTWIRNDYQVEVSARPVDDSRNPASVDYAVQYDVVLTPRSR